MKAYDVIVVGAGVSGLVLAEHAVRAGASTLVLEQAPDVGGCLQGWEAAPGFVVEMGAHTAYNSYGPVLEILQQRGRLQELMPREKLGYLFLDQGRLQSPMARVNVLEAALHVPLGLFRSKAGKDLRTYFGSLLGPGNYRRVLSPAFAAVLSQSCDGYPAEWLFRRKPRMKEAPRKYTFAGGLQGLLMALVPGGGYALRTGVRVTGVTRTSAEIQVAAGDELLSCRKLALATPPDVAARLLGQSWPALAACLTQFPMVQIESTAVRVARDKVSLPALAGIIGLDGDFYSVVSRDPVPHPQYRGFTFHFQPGRLDLGGKLDRIAAVLGVAVEDIEAVSERVNRLPGLDLRHPALAAELDASLAGEPLALAGNYFKGMSIGDCAERAVVEAKRLFGQGVQR